MQFEKCEVELFGKVDLFRGRDRKNIVPKAAGVFS